MMYVVLQAALIKSLVYDLMAARPTIVMIHARIIARIDAVTLYHQKRDARRSRKAVWDTFPYSM
jgi:hypothetical protein